MTEKFKKCLQFTLKWEGGKVDHPADPGGRTAYGITQSVYNTWRKSKKLPPRDVWNITMDEVHQIYFEKYWTPIKCELLPPPLDLVVFDTGVNCGIGRAARWLNTALGLQPLMSVTNQTIKKVKELKGDEVMKVARKVWELRKQHYETIVQRNPKLKVFLRGWMNRINDLRKVTGI
ncbi:MAG: glycosyl hydrolase 108 family protein [Candidatus Hadarchaeales archaeon]